MRKVRSGLTVSIVCAGLLWAGAVMAAPGGEPGPPGEKSSKGGNKQCKADLDTCSADLGTCNADLGTCDADLNTCNTDLTQAQGDLTQSQTDLATCNTDLGTCNNNFGTCSADLTACEGTLTTTEGALATCNTDLGTCDADLVACLAEPNGLFPATGQTTAYQADKNDGIAGPVDVPDDGTVQAGAPLSYTDNGDGTITDNNTGLMWEKKVGTNGCLHCVNDTFRWSGDGSQETIWDWLDPVNAEGGTGFAGFDDWRIPNVKELQSIVDYEHTDPSIDPIFGPTAASFYWSSTTGDFNPADAWGVNFFNGFVGLSTKFEVRRVRAVRGGL